MKAIPADTSDEMTIATTMEMSTSHLGPDLSFYSTPSMVRHFEGLCVRMLLPYLEPGENSVGYRVEVRHLAPTRIGEDVKVKARLKSADGRKCLFELEAYNGAGVKIGDGLHERRLVDLARFGRSG